MIGQIEKKTDQNRDVRLLTGFKAAGCQISVQSHFLNFAFQCFWFSFATKMPHGQKLFIIQGDKQAKYIVQIFKNIIIVLP